jgi:hypothetical protein
MAGANRALADVLHWVWTFRLQTRRLIEGLRQEWSTPDPGVLPEQQFSRSTADLHFLTTCGEHVCLAIARAVELGFALPTPSATQRDQLKLLRNIYEHWSDYTPWDPTSFAARGHLARSGRDLVTRYPSADPFSFRFDGVIGGVFDATAFIAFLDTVEDEARRQSGLPAQGSISTPPTAGGGSEIT